MFEPSVGNLARPCPPKTKEAEKAQCEGPGFTLRNCQMNNNHDDDKLEGVWKSTGDSVCPIGRPWVSVLSQWSS